MPNSEIIRNFALFNYLFLRDTCVGLAHNDVLIVTKSDVTHRGESVSVEASFFLKQWRSCLLLRWV